METPEPHAANRQEEPCWQCDGAGDINYLGHWDTCDACNGTGLLYTEQAIRDQVAVEDEHREDA